MASYMFRTSDLPKLDINTDRGTDFQAWHQQWLAYRSLDVATGHMMEVAGDAQHSPKLVGIEARWDTLAKSVDSHTPQPVKAQRPLKQQTSNKNSDNQ